MPTLLPELKKILEDTYGQEFIINEALKELYAFVDKNNLFSLMEKFSTIHFDFLMDVTAVDYLLQNKKPRFEVVYHLFHTKTYDRIRIKVPVTEEIPEVASVYPIWKTAYFLEREVWDLYGIKFTGHPDLRRILLYEEFVGFPLRKDYYIRDEQPLIGLREVEANPTV